MSRPSSRSSNRVFGGPPFSLPNRPAVRKLRSGQPAPVDETNRRPQELPGYEGGFSDIVDYIVRITDEIWLDRAIGRIYDTYDHACTVYSSYGVVRSVEEVVASTTSMLNGFVEPRIEHLNIAWTETDEGFYTSHLGFSRSINAGRSYLGPATGREVALHFAADCVSRENRIHTEWLVRDTGSLVKQLGLDIQTLAQAMGATPTLEHFIVSPPTRLEGQIPRVALEIPDNDAEGWARHMFHNLWNLKRLDWLDRYYSADVIVHAGGGRSAHGLHNLGSLLLLVQATIPDGIMRVCHVCHSEEADGVILAVRWVIEGTCRAGGLFDDVPVGKPVFMMGVSHLRFAGERICEEWMIFDELGVLAQTYRS